MCLCFPLGHQEIYTLQKDKEEVKQHCESLQKEKAKMERQLEDTSSQVNPQAEALVPVWSFLQLLGKGKV